MAAELYLNESQVAHHHPQLLLTLIHLSFVCLWVGKGSPYSLPLSYGAKKDRCWNCIWPSAFNGVYGSFLLEIKHAYNHI